MHATNPDMGLMLQKQPLTRWRGDWEIWGGWWPERIASWLAISGLVASILTGFHVRTRQGSSSDFKTLYSSAWCFARGFDAYRFQNLQSVFVANGVKPPKSWYGHAPVYPPFTLGLIAPLTSLRMVPAIYLWELLCGVAVACALTALVQAAGEQLGLERRWRLMIIALTAALPLLSFGIEMGNVSVIVMAMCVLAVSGRENAETWWRAAALAVGLLLKPHLALWVVVALLLMRGWRSLAIRAAGLAAFAATLLLLVASTAHGLGAQLGSYRAMLASEMASGSMGVGNHELMDVEAQITSLASLVGFWHRDGAATHAVEWMLLAAAAIALVRVSLQLKRPSAAERFCLLGAWSTLGLIATYHRAADGVMLILLLPWVIGRIRQNGRDTVGWTVILLVAAMSCATRWETMWWVGQVHGLYWASEFLLYRQAPLAALILMGVMVAVMVKKTAFMDQPWSDCGQNDNSIRRSKRG